VGLTEDTACCADGPGLLGGAVVGDVVGATVGRGWEGAALGPDGGAVGDTDGRDVVGAAVGRMLGDTVITGALVGGDVGDVVGAADGTGENLTTRIFWLFLSAMKTLPDASTATAYGP